MSSSLSIFEPALDGVVKDEFISVLDNGTSFFEEAEGWSISQPNNKKTNANITKLYMVINMRNLIINTTQKRMG